MISTSDNRKVRSNIEYFHIEKQTLFGVETLPAINDSEKLHEIVYEKWKIKNEELDIKEDDLDHKETSILSDCRFDDTPRKALEHDPPTITKNSLCIKMPTSFKSAKGQLLQCGNSDFNALQKDSLKEQLFHQKNTQEKVDLLKCSSKGSSKGQLLQCNSELNIMFKRDQCSVENVSKFDLNNHILQYHNPKEIKSGRYEWQTISKSTSNKHLLQQLNPRKVNMFNCSQRKHKIIYNNLTKHFRLHKNAEFKRLKSIRCENQTFRKRNFKKHFFFHKNLEKGKHFKCDVCQYQALYQNTLQVHMLWHVNLQERKKFECKYNLKTHMLQYKNLAECDVCKYQAPNQNALKVHMLWHVNSQKHKRFECKYNLKTHMLQHKNLPECDVCKYQALNQNTLKVHMLWNVNS